MKCTCTSLAARNRKSAPTWAVLPCLIVLSSSVAKAQDQTVAFRDDFDTATLAEGWAVVNEVPADWSLDARSGFFRISTRRGTLGNESSVENLLVREFTGDFLLEGRVEIDPRQGQQFGGLVAYVSDEQAVSVGLAFASGDRGEFRGAVLLSVGNEQTGDATRPGSRYDETTVDNPTSIYLRLLRSGDQFLGAYSEDGVTFTDVGIVTNDLPDTIRVGVGAANGDEDGCGAECDASIPADFDFFQISTIDGGGEPAVVLTGLEVTGPESVASGGQAVFTATASFSDGTESDVTDLASWASAPQSAGSIDGGTFTAETVTSATQATIVADYSEQTATGTTSATGAVVVRIDPPPVAGGAPCGAGAMVLMPLGILGYCRFTRRGRSDGREPSR